MTGNSVDHELTSALGKVDRVTRQDVPILYQDVAFDIEAIQAGWPEFEAKLDTLRGRRMMAVVFPERGIYRLATTMRDDDDPDALGLSMGALPGGSYLRLRLIGQAPGIYKDIGPAFDELTYLGDHDPSRPSIELYVRHDQVDCLLPVHVRSQ